MGSLVQLGVDVTKIYDYSADTGPYPYSEGDRHIAADGTHYIYTKAHGAIADGTRCNVLDTGVTSANGSGVWVNNTGTAMAVSDRFWAHQYIASNIITF